MDLVNQTHWDEGYQEQQIELNTGENPLKEWLFKQTKIKPSGSCLEIGVFPGAYIELFGRLGYRISGMDLTPRVVELNDYFKEKGYAVGEFIQEDFFSYKSEELFDIVCSFGFIEHFDDYGSVILKHGDLLKSNGLLIITTPNFRGWLQYRLHKWIDTENLKRHNIHSMDPKEWKEILEKNGYDVIEYGYVDSFDFWAETKNANYVKKALRRIVVSLTPLLKKILPQGKAFCSPYCVITAQKK